jgi:hypothetical protein
MPGKEKYLKWSDPRRIVIPDGMRRVTHGLVKKGDFVYQPVETPYSPVGFRKVGKSYIRTKVSEWWLIIRSQKCENPPKKSA